METVAKRNSATLFRFLVVEPNHSRLCLFNRFTTASARRLFDYYHNDRTRNNGAKLIVKHFNTLFAHHFYPIKIITTWNALPNEVISCRTVNSFKNSLDKHWTENPSNVLVNWQQSSMPCKIRKAFCWKWTQ